MSVDNHIGGVNINYSEGARISLERAHGIDLAKERRLTAQERAELQIREGVAIGKRIEELLGDAFVELLRKV